MFSSNNIPPSILLVDDDASQITILNKALNAIGQVFFEQNGLDALEQATKIRPDVILLDIDMPGMNGHQVLAQLKNNESTCNIPVIFITSYDSVEDQLLCLREGAVDFIAKPLQPDVVAARVRTHLKLRNRERELVEIHQHAQVTLDAIGNSVITTDKDARVTFMNPAAELMTGMSLSDAMGCFIEKVMPLRIGHDGPPHINPVRICLQENRVVGIALNCQMMKQNGHWISVEDSAAPLISQDGDVTGSVIVFDDINESRAMALKMSHTLQYDQLTNLPNRFLLMERLNTKIARSQKNSAKIGLIMFDINRFKLINEEFGFEFGDELLKKIAQRIKSQLQNNETLSRQNADEFMVLVPELERPSDLANLAVMIRDHVMGLTVLQPEILNFSISMGLSVYPDDAVDAQSLLLHADAALHRAKTDPIYDGFCFYSEEMESRFISRRQRYMQLKSAIADNNVIALYQPIVDVDTGSLKAVEALMRIKEQDGSLIPPIEFIPLAEETRLIIPLGKKMIQLAFEQLKQWCNEGLDIRMCLNISPIQFLDPHFVPFLLKAIDDYQVRPKMIELELTESLMLDNLQQVIRDMEQLRIMGISISLDDFGTGFSCLSYLKELPVDVLKIDKSFVAQLSIEKPDETLVKTITTLAQSMGLKSVAEGVESLDQALRLKELGVSYLQGYYFSRPVTANEVRGSYDL
ncbi:EAL domain-containing protein [Pseudoalteromonas sp. SR41-4]|uniref:two-component system response regulator n=1 Tax=Pseudoalteromonas sp. SR41-4 TaxID=2760950 RepID=UPI0015FF36A6|nr:EAL domain-containing protein [Pseudoalteromonas sp. SR41-4]MBB1295510.1 EAL domain-containing protein [Pseudoalteromonas sp. SR41-4]